MRNKATKNEGKTAKQWGEKSVFRYRDARILRGCIVEMLKVVRDKAVKCCYLVIYEEVCDTCDSKNNKTPVSARVRVRARGSDYSYFHC